jgi:hypothetical protein
MDTPGQDCQGDFATPRTALTNFTTTIIDPWENSHVISAIDSTTTFCTLSAGSRQCASMTRLQKPTVLSSGMVFATPFAVYWQESDLAAFPSDYASSLAAVIAVGVGLFVILGIVIL